MAAKFVIGDVVKLKSDGPWMTVTRDKVEIGSKFVGTAWFSGSDLKSEVFPKEALEHDPARKAADEKKDTKAE